MYRHLPSPVDLDAVLAKARSLQRAAESGTPPPLLRGRNLGLLCDTEDPAADLFVRAASELGARVSQVRAHLSERCSPVDVNHMAHMLGRLYDAVDCEGLPPAVVDQVSHAAGIPVYDRLSSTAHATAALTPLLDGSDDDKRRYIVQAVLLTSLGR